MPSNPIIILTELNRLLNQQVELNIFGASALNLGFSGNIGEKTRDVDLIIPAEDVPKVEANMDFWDAKERLNRNLEEQDLYISHVFEDRQIILTKDWVSRRVPIHLPLLDRITAFRPSTEDLLLSKMMRNDAEDKHHITFLLQQGGFSDGFLQDLFNRADIPDIQEIRDIFSALQGWVRAENNRLQEVSRP